MSPRFVWDCLGPGFRKMLNSNEFYESRREKSNRERQRDLPTYTPGTASLH